MQPSGRHSYGWQGLTLVFLVYFYFLLFSQFSLLHILEARLGDGKLLKGVLGSMALSGMIGSWAAYRYRKQVRTGQVFAPALLVCSMVALATPFIEQGAIFILLAMVMGLALGLLTVSVAALLPALTPRNIRGRIVGAGTGLAYAVCNLPIVFESTAENRALFSGAVLFIGGLLMIRFRLPGQSDRMEAAESVDTGIKWTRSAGMWLVFTFAILIWLDSAIFYLIQENRSLKSMSWEGQGQLYSNAGLHLAGALLAGWILDRSRGMPLLILAWLGLAVGAVGLQSTSVSAFVTPYVLGVSLYSTALVFIPSLHAAYPGDRNSFARAAAVFAIAGWLCSGMGIGMAENLSSVPMTFVILSAIIVVPVVKLSPLLK